MVVHAGADVLAEPAAPAATAGVSAETPGRGAGPRRPGGPGTLPRGGRPGGQRVHRADAQLRGRAVVDDPRRRRRRAGPGETPAPPQRRDPPRRPRTGPLPVPVPGLRVPAGRPAPHPVLGQRRPHRPGQPDQLVPLPPQGGARPRLPHRRPARRRRLRVLPPGRHPAAVQPAPARTRRQHRGNPRRGHHPGARSSRPGTASASTWTTPSTSASPTPAPRSKNKPTGSRSRSRSSGRTPEAATSATRSTTSAGTTTNTRPPDNSDEFGRPPPLYPREE